MRFATLKSGQVVAGTKDGYRVVDNRKSMVEVMENPSGLTFSGDAMELPETLAPPVPRPSKIWAAAGNFYRGVNVKDPDGKSSRGHTTTLTKDELLHSIFLKPPSAVIGPGDDVVIPPGATGVFPEIELCIVIGKRSRNLTVEQAPSAIFGYSILLDITARNYGPEKSGRTMRCVRKGYETFAPFGPVVKRPVPLESKRAVLDDGNVCGRELAHSAERGQRRRYIAEAEIQRQRLLVGRGWDVWVLEQ